MQAGARVSQILAALKEQGLTLENFSSITEQQVGGWTQVSAHGTGARIPPVDEMVTEMQVVSPSRGPMTLSKGSELFEWLKVGLGSLAVVQELTLKVRKRYQLHEKTFCASK